MTLLEMMQPRQECVRLYDDIKVNIHLIIRSFHL
jgi:hypothetical protein